MLAAAGASALAKHFLGDEVASSDEVADSMEQSEDMPVEQPRQRRFWVRLFISHRTT